MILGIRKIEDEEKDQSIRSNEGRNGFKNYLKRSHLSNILMIFPSMQRAYGTSFS